MRGIRHPWLSLLYPGDLDLAASGAREAAGAVHILDPRARIEIIDEGPGISEEDRVRIFDKFEIVKLKEPGEMQMGLGLAFCKMVVEAHGGYIFVKPNQATGSIFTIEV